MENTTIAAIATPQGIGGVGIIRISGPDSVRITEEIFSSYTEKKVADLDGFSGTVGVIKAGEEIIDEVIVFRYKAPKSYTGEEVVEISGHGGSWVITKTLRLCYEKGALPAEAGEFTKRAFMNGKLDLTQAEAVMDIISAKGDAALRAANLLHEGELSKQIISVADSIVTQAGHLAAWADFPDEDLEELKESKILKVLNDNKDTLSKLVDTYDYGRILKEGIDTAIVGKPNVGKSTLMNLLAGFERSIVSDIPGTTRDIVSESAKIGDLVLQLSDTAGLRSSDDIIEKIGVDRAKKQINNARLVFVIMDSSATLDKEDMLLLESVKSKPTIVLINKSDLDKVLQIDEIRKIIPFVIEISAKDSTGLDDLEDMIRQVLEIDIADSNQVVIANERQRILLNYGIAALDEAINALEEGITLDAVTVCLEDSLDNLLSLTGQKASDRIVTQIFSNFCVGK